MIRSMTAFAGTEVEIGNLTLTCELRSVNHRYSDINIKLPERLRFIESELRTLIAGKISRGKIECSLNYKKQAKDGQTFIVNTQAVAALLSATDAIEQQMSAALSFSALDVLAFPGIQQEPETDKEVLAEAIIDLVTQALAQLHEVRGREGAQLKLLIEDRCFKMQHYVALASKRLPEVLNSLRRKLKERIRELVAEPNFDRLEQELVLLAQKLDITEELDRLQTHITEVLRVLNQPEPVGRRLDFLMQELNREANTLGSKSQDKDMTQISIELKVLIEQMREQIQNVE
ncbi:MAG: YicC/YloC family endoribonuclease [Methylococcaceae bacterium]|nr:YicC/YloC family endoribonuclease [Methylococcaceae bacterium]MDP2392709.1 YicC/YloC family endoribonuclease [Methylococcaceae bacterium]MDP3018574.1 YicC/YloC family endoribonuclease [Methylococcaceae bacterium]MDP3391329.1 YicC/YloC family endoribonuclease [Methylococcaceae bacterium]MDZ4156990.1 YicC/YloC family endoribonuclease [Methylococcales bacterium]